MSSILRTSDQPTTTDALASARAGAALALPMSVAECARLSTEEVLAAFGTDADGLSAQEVALPRARYGANELPSARRHAAWLQFLGALMKPLPLALLGLAAVNFMTDQPWAGAVIGVMVVLSTLLSFVQEYRSDRAAQRLRELVHSRVRVQRRTGKAAHTVALPPSQLVPGDIVNLSAGDAVPADLQLLHCRDLFIDQSALTGESLPVEKLGMPAAQPPAALHDLPNITFMGTSVVSGTALAIVLATGARTEFGAVAGAVASAREETSFDRGLRRFISFMLRVMFAMMLVVFALNGLMKSDWLQAFQFALAVAVGLAPELLPVVVTVNLAKGALAMADRKCIVKRLSAIQDVGAMDILCTDKTGTLTQNRVILARHVDIDGNEARHVTELAYLNSHFQTGLRNLLDKAIIDFAHTNGIVPSLDYRKVDELPYDFQRRRMSVILQRPDGRRVLVCKGAVEEMLNCCNRAMRSGGNELLQAHHGQDLLRAADKLNHDGFRVLAVAVRELTATAPATVADESGMTLAGYIAFLDPPKSGAREALAALREQGISVKVLTGDNEAVTRHVARHVGVVNAQVLSGIDLAAADPATLAAQVEEADLLVKLTPQQKVDVIRSLQSQGHVVGYLGDGINDAAALMAADVGISVDTASDIGKESADVILLRKSLMVVSEGVREGRRVFANIRKYLRMSASSNFGNMLSVLGASILLPFLPMAPVQILLNNLLYDFSQTALASDHVDSELLAAPHRWNITEVWHAMVVLGPVSSLFDYLTFALLWYGLRAPASLFQTGWFLESLLSQTLVVHIIRTGRIPLLQSRPSPLLLATTVLVCLCGLWLPASPLAHARGFAPLPAAYWTGLPLILLAYLGLVQLVKNTATLKEHPR